MDPKAHNFIPNNETFGRIFVIGPKASKSVFGCNNYSPYEVRMEKILACTMLPFFEKSRRINPNPPYSSGNLTMSHAMGCHPLLFEE